jgi:hypothetical protein
VVRVRENILDNPELIHFYINELRELSGYIKFQFTQYLRISYLYILNNINNNKFLIKELKEIEYLGQFNKVLNGDRLKALKLELRDEICLGVFPTQAIMYAFNTIEFYPNVKSRIKLLYFLAKDYCVNHNLLYFKHLSYWIFSLLFPKKGMYKATEQKQNQSNFYGKEDKEDYVVKNTSGIPPKNNAGANFMNYLSTNQDIMKAFIVD